YKMKFYPMTYIFTVDKTIRMTSESVHVPVTFRNTTVTHNNCDLMQCFRQKRPEIPVIVSTSHIGSRIAFNCVIQVGKFHRVAEKENRCIISNQIPDSLIGIK